MKLSVSNLAWGDTSLLQVAESLVESGIQGIEVAPTAIWGSSLPTRARDVQEYGSICRSFGLSVSGVQSLLYGRPDCQLFDPTTWPELLVQLQKMVRIAGLLEADVAVFGSPKNRVKSAMPDGEADEIATVFFSKLIPTLVEENVVLTLEPNAPEYGADYLTSYADTLRLVGSLNSRWIQPQIDTGCMKMVSEDCVRSVDEYLPAHVHISAPFLEAPTADMSYLDFKQTLLKHDYQGWVVLEMLKSGVASNSHFSEVLRWFKTSFTARSA